MTVRYEMEGMRASDGRLLPGHHPEGCIHRTTPRPTTSAGRSKTSEEGR